MLLWSGVLPILRWWVDCGDQHPFECFAFSGRGGDIECVIERTAVLPMLGNAPGHVQARPDIGDLVIQHKQIHA